jgi:hypothetical protein
MLTKEARPQSSAVMDVSWRWAVEESGPHPNLMVEERRKQLQTYLNDLARIDIV